MKRLIDKKELKKNRKKKLTHLQWRTSKTQEREKKRHQQKK